MTLIALLWIFPALAILISLGWPKHIKHEYLNLIVSVIVFAFSLILLTTSPSHQKILLSGYVSITPFGNWVTFCVAVVYLMSSIYSVGYIGLLNFDLKKKTHYYSLLEAFALSMLLAPFMNNPGLYWIAIDFTTIVSAFLVGIEREAESIEAAWKYLIVVSAGLSLSLLGIVLFYWAGTFHLGPVYAMTWQSLHSISNEVPTSLLLISFLLVLVGFGTKAGLAPMHTWLPDAHSEGPAPVSAMLSGALLNIAVFGIVRFMSILNGTNASGPAHLAIIIIGIISLVIAALFIVRQHGIKRLMAYSSIEHIAIISIGFGFGTPLGIAGAMYQMINHSINKSMMFFGSGNMMRSYGSKEINKIRKILDTYPVSGILWLLGAIAITGAPPFGLFQSEMSILRAGLLGKNSWAVWVIGILLIVIFIGFLNHFRSMYFGEDIEPSAIPTLKLNAWLTTPMWISLLAILIFGLWWPSGIMHFFLSAGNSL